jgi:hypothetical protein
MFLRVLGAMMAADAIDRHLRAQQQLRLAEEMTRPAEPRTRPSERRSRPSGSGQRDRPGDDGPRGR